MSSLSQQLKAISEKNASVALDRKSRSAIHSSSLIFDFKTAAAQDLDYIYSVALEGLEELITIDPRFAKFNQSLFAETSIGFDRNVHSKDVVSLIDKNIAAFLNLAAPYLNLGPTLKAIEWLIRRYHANIHSPETLLLAVLPYHNHPIFTRFSNVVTKSSWPQMFTPLLPYKEKNQPPPASSILKMFHNDPAFFRLYSQHIAEQLRNKTIYKELLIFYVSNTVQALASHARDPQKLNNDYIPPVLEAAIEFFRDNSLRYSVSTAADIRLSIYTIMSVLSSLVPLSDDLIFTFSRSIILGELAFSPVLRKHTLIALGQLWKFYNDFDLPRGSNIFAKLPLDVLLQDESLLRSLLADDYGVAKFLYFYFIDRSQMNAPEAARVLELFDCSQSAFMFEATSKKLLEILATPNAEKVRGPAFSCFQKMIKTDKQKLVDILKAQNKSIDALEIILMRTLVSSTDEEPVVSTGPDLVIDVNVSGDKQKLFNKHKSKVTSFMSSKSTTEFFALVAVLLKALKDPKDQLATLSMFVKSTLQDWEARSSFLLRLSFTPSIPTNTRLNALLWIRAHISRKESKSNQEAFYLMIPILLLGLADKNKSFRRLIADILDAINGSSKELASKKNGKKIKCHLFLESQIYGDLDPSKRSIISPLDGFILLDILAENDSCLKDILIDPSRASHLVFGILFTSSRPGQKKFGSLLLRTFILNQWSLPSLALVFKSRAWSFIAQHNAATNGTEDRFLFVEDLKSYFTVSEDYKKEASLSGIEYAEVQEAISGMVGGHTSNEKSASKETEWLLKALTSDGSLQIAANTRLIALFPTLKSNEMKLKICNELVDSITSDNELFLQYDPLETLQSLKFSSQFMVSLLNTVNIVTQIPEQGVAKRRRRSSSSTQKTMARDDISSMASTHLKKLSVILDVLEVQLRKDSQTLANPELLEAIFKILTDLDYLCADGRMPVLYAQETLASCMLLTIVHMKTSMSNKKLKLDSRSIRADLIVNSIRLSQSPQVQNRLLLVIAELASLAPEIILHSVMPIFTFMGAHTIRQDDEFSSSALQQTISKVVPAIASASDSASGEIEFLLTSFITAFQHIPRHRRVKLFISLVKTLGSENSLHTILFLLGQQYSANIAKHKQHECSSLTEFMTSLLKTFSPEECISSIRGFFLLWETIPMQELDKNSDEYKQLNGRSIYGSAVVSMTTKELQVFKCRMLSFLNQVLISDDEHAMLNGVNSLKMKIALVLFDPSSSESGKELILSLFNQSTSFILGSLDTYINNADSKNESISNELYLLLKSLLNLLPLSYYLSSIIESLTNLSDPLSINVAKNFATLAGSRFENEVNSATLTEEVSTVVLEKFLPALVDGVETSSNTELVQAYLDTFAIIVNKCGATEMTRGDNSKILIGSLKVITSQSGLLNPQVEVIVSSLNAITSVINCLGVKCIGFFPKILPPSLTIWENTLEEEGNDDAEEEENDDAEDDESEDTESKMLLQGATLMLFSCLVKKMPAFVISSLKPMFSAVLKSDYVENSIRSAVLTLIVDHVDKVHVLQALCNLSLTENIHELDNPASLGLYSNAMKNAIEGADKKAVSSQASLILKWMIKSFEFRSEFGEEKFNNNTINSIEGSFHQCGLLFVMKLNDKSFRPLFAGLVRWAFNGEGSFGSDETTRLVAFFKFFNKLQDNLKSIITSYYSYLLDPTIKVLKEFNSEEKREVNLRRLVLHSLSSSFKYDQDDYWSHQSRFETIIDPLVGQLSNIEDSIGKHLVKCISFFVTNVSSDEYNEKLVYALIRYISNEYENTLNTKIWTIRVLKTIFQKIGDQWLSFLPTFIPYIAELLEDEDEAVELEVRRDLVRVIENILGEPLDRYLG